MKANAKVFGPSLIPGERLVCQRMRAELSRKGFAFLFPRHQKQPDAEPFCDEYNDRISVQAAQLRVRDSGTGGVGLNF